MLKVVLFATLVACAMAHLGRMPGPFSNRHLLGRVADPLVCETTFALGGKRFNVSSLVLDVGGYVTDNSYDNNSYCLNICKAVTSERNCICYPCDNRTYPVSQVVDSPTTGETCSAYLGQLNAASWALQKPSDPSAGLLLSYGHGQDGRSTEIHLNCDPKAPQYTMPVFVGPRQKVYVFQWNTTAACPL